MSPDQILINIKKMNLGYIEGSSASETMMRIPIQLRNKLIKTQDGLSESKRVFNKIKNIWERFRETYIKRKNNVLVRFDLPMFDREPL
jgi:hypothetical protein